MQPVTKQQKILLANSEHLPAMIEIMKDCRTELHTIISKDEFHTLVNALTLELESALIQRVVVYLEQIKEGKLHE